MTEHQSYCKSQNDQALITFHRQLCLCRLLLLSTPFHLYQSITAPSGCFSQLVLKIYAVRLKSFHIQSDGGQCNTSQRQH